MAGEMERQDALYEACEELEKYTNLEGSEWGETAVRLSTMWQTRTLLSDKFVKALEKELLDWLKYVKKHTSITEREETFTRKITELEWD